MTGEEKERLVQMLTDKFSIDELLELTTLLKKGSCEIEIDLNSIKKYRRDLIYAFSVWFFGDENSQLRAETKELIEIYLAD